MSCSLCAKRAQASCGVNGATAMASTGAGFVIPSQIEIEAAQRLRLSRGASDHNASAVGCSRC